MDADRFHLFDEFVDGLELVFRWGVITQAQLAFTVGEHVPHLADETVTAVNAVGIPWL